MGIKGGMGKGIPWMQQKKWREKKKENNGGNMNEGKRYKHETHGVNNKGNVGSVGSNEEGEMVTWMGMNETTTSDGMVMSDSWVIAVLQ